MQELTDAEVFAPAELSDADVFGRREFSDAEIGLAPGAWQGQLNTARKSWHEMLGNLDLGMAVGALERLAPEYKRQQLRASIASSVSPNPLRSVAENEAEIDKLTDNAFRHWQNLTPENSPEKRQFQEERAADQELLAAAIAGFARAQRTAAAIPESADVQRYQQTPGFWNKLGVVARNPVELPVNIAIKGGVQSVPVIAGAVAGGATLGPAGAIGATGLMSLRTEYVASLVDQLAQEDVDLQDKAAVLDKLRDPLFFTKASEHAAERSVPIAAFDALSAAIGGRTIRQGLTRAQTVKALAREITEQGALGGAGEFSGQVASGEAIDPTSIFEEVIGEVAAGTRDIAQGALARPSSRRTDEGSPGTPLPSVRPPEDELPPPPTENPNAPRTPPDPNLFLPQPPLSSTPVESITTENVPGATDSTPVPEAGQTIELQMDMLRQGKRSVVLITPGEAMPEVPGNMKTVEVPAVGTFIYSPRVHREEAIVAAAKAGKLGRILGYGIPAKPAPGTEVGAVTVRTADGTEKQAVVTDAQNLPKVVQAAEKVADTTDSVQLEPPEQVIAGRLEQKPTPETKTSLPSLPSVEVLPRHRDEARQILQDTERPPDIFDELDSVDSGTIQFPAADFADALSNVREAISQALFQKPYDQLRKPQRERVDRQHRLSTTEGGRADEVLKGLAEHNPKFANWTSDHLADAMARAAVGRLQRAPSASKIEQLAQEIATAEERGSLSRSTPDEANVEEVSTDAIENWFNEAIAATNLNRKQTREGVTGAPVWLTKAALNGVLRVIRATYRGTKNLAHALQAGIEWLRAQNLPDFSETEARAWMQRAITTTPQDNDINLREFTDQLDAEQPLPPDPARMVSNLLYDRRTNESDAAFAARIIAAVGGPAAAVDVFSDATNGMPASVRMLLGQLIIKQLGAAGQHEAAARFYDETFAAHITETAQALQSLAAFLALTPEGKVIWARRKIERAARDLIAPVQPQLDAAKTELDAANKEGIEATTAAPDVQAAARTAVDSALENQAAKLGTELQQAIRQTVLDDLVKAGLLTAREAEIYKLFLDGAGQGATLQQLLESAGIPHHDQRATAINQLYKARTQAERNKLKSRAQKARKAQLAGGEDSAIDTALKKAMKELRVMLGQVIREHHTQADALGKSLAEKIAAASSLSEAEAKKLAEAVQRRFAALVTQRKKAALEKLLKPVRPIAKPALIEKLIALSNLGALSQEQFWNAVRAQLNLPAWSPELAERIRHQVDAIERVPADQTERKQKAQIELLNLIERAKGLDGYDLAIAFYVTNILTGVTTHLKNLGSTFLNVSGTLGTEIARSVASGHLDDVPVLLEALGQGLKRGKLAAGDVLRTGTVTGSRLTKLEPGRALELTQFGQRGGVPVRGKLSKAVLENRLAGILNLWKYNFRMMAAEDLLFFKPAEEAKAALLAKRLARSEGLRGEAARDRARQLMGYGPRAVATARAQATQEGFTGNAHARRTAEILNANRPEALAEDARQFALRSTFNNAPYGALGFVASLINQAKVAPNHKIRLGANLIAPFTNIIANVVNESLNYTPIGILRARWAGEKLLGYEKGKLSLEQQADLRAELQAKALVGTALLAGFALKAAGDLDDKDPEFAIYGAGPASAQDRQGLEAKGWIAHSVKIGSRYYSFANTPQAIPLAWLGNIYDRLRDARLFENTSALRTEKSLPLMAASSAVGMAKVITEQSFMVGLMDLAGTLSEPSPEAGGRGLLKRGVQTASSFVIPNAVRQVDKAFDPKQYEQRTAEGILVNAIPFVRGLEGQPSLNALGRPIERPLSRQFTSSQADVPPLVKYLAESGNWPSMPDRNHIYPRTGRTMTEAEYYQYVRGSGQLAYNYLERLRANGTLGRYKDDKTRAKVIAEYFETSRKQWRSRNGW